MKSLSIALFASGTGTNAVNMVHYFKNNPSVSINCLFCNKTDAPVLEKMKEVGIDSFILTREEFYHSNTTIELLKSRKIDLIVLVGFLWLIPPTLVKAYPDAIINIHPALLPKFGGKGMYGLNVHKAVKEAGEHETGITIHLVNEEYDKGKHLAQFSVTLTKNDTPETIAQKVHLLEQEHLPVVIEHYCQHLQPKAFSERPA